MYKKDSIFDRNKPIINWKKKYLEKIVFLLHMYHVTTRIALRTQVINSGTFIGNRACYEPINNFIRFVSSLSKIEFFNLLKFFEIENTVPFKIENYCKIKL
jgi:hypothetical protein